MNPPHYDYHVADAIREIESAANVESEKRSADIASNANVCTAVSGFRVVDA